MLSLSPLPLCIHFPPASVLQVKLSPLKLLFLWLLIGLVQQKEQETEEGRGSRVQVPSLWGAGAASPSPAGFFVPAHTSGSSPFTNFSSVKPFKDAIAFLIAL